MQHSLAVKLNKRCKKQYFDISDVNEKSFWGQIEAIFLKKSFRLNENFA